MIPPTYLKTTKYIFRWIPAPGGPYFGNKILEEVDGLSESDVLDAIQSVAVIPITDERNTDFVGELPNNVRHDVLDVILCFTDILQK